MNLTWLRLRGKVKGLVNSMPYTPLIESGDSSSYFGNYEGQRYGKFDTNCCWDYSACEVAETRLEMLEKLGMIPQDTLDWAKSVGFKDEDGDWYVSRRWVAILSGVRDNGNFQIDFWSIASVAGLIPNKILPYDPKSADKWLSKTQFNNDYFNPQVITKEMEEIGKEFARRFKILAENIPGGYFEQISANLQMYLKEGSMQIGHPVPQDGSWNQVSVLYPVGRTVADHATELYKFDPLSSYPYKDYDSYNPNLKQLSRNYFIPIVTRVLILPVNRPVVIPSTAINWQKFWYNLFAWFAKKPLPYPNVPIGSA